MREKLHSHLLDESLNKLEAEEIFGLKKRPMVQTVSPFCTTAVNRLKAGPPNIPEIICSQKQWTDTSFNTSMAVWWNGYTNPSEITQWN
jgi:hypothetical protein